MLAASQELRYLLRGLSALAVVLALALLWARVPESTTAAEVVLTEADIPPVEEILNVRAALTYALHRAYHTAWLIELEKRPRPLICATLSTGRPEAFYMLGPVAPRLSLSPLQPIPWDVQRLCHETNKLMAV